MGRKQLPKCKKKNCLYNIGGRCKILNSCDFKDRECSFFKEKEIEKDDK